MHDHCRRISPRLQDEQCRTARPPHDGHNRASPPPHDDHHATAPPPGDSHRRIRPRPHNTHRRLCLASVAALLRKPLYGRQCPTPTYQSRAHHADHATLTSARHLGHSSGGRCGSCGRPSAGLAREKEVVTSEIRARGPATVASARPAKIFQHVTRKGGNATFHRSDRRRDQLRLTRQSALSASLASPSARQQSPNTIRSGGLQQWNPPGMTGGKI